MKQILILIFLTTSIFGYAQKDSVDVPRTMYDIRKNSLYNIDILLTSYERVFPVSDRVGCTAMVGVLIWDPFNLVGEVGGIFGGPVHFGELGAGYHVNLFDSEWNMPFFRAGYRVQLRKGFMAKAGGAFVLNPFGDTYGGLLPVIGLGYAF